jgi:hypothetical protein
MYHQYKANSFPKTPGTITHSKVTSSHSDDGTTYGVEVKYSYNVNGQKHFGDTYRYGEMSSSGGRAHRIIKTLQVGKEVDVYYDPDDPNESLLVPGIDSMQLFMALFLTPFNIIMLAVWGAFCQSFFNSKTEMVAGGAEILPVHYGVHVRLPQFPPIAAAAGSAIGISFVSIFVVGFGFSMEPPMWAIGGIWGLMLVVAFGIFFWRKSLIAAGLKDLVIDLEQDTITLPQTYGRSTDITIPFQQVSNVTTRKEVHRSQKNNYTEYCPTIEFKDDDGEELSEKLAAWRDEAKADSLTEWLTERLVSNGP